MTKLLPILLLFMSSWGLQAQNYPMDNIQINDCGGFFLDSGGANGTYSPNENLTTTICPDFSSGTHVQLVFSAPEIMTGDNLCFFDGTDATAMPLFCAADFEAGTPFIVQATAENPTGCLTLTFNSDGNGEGAGWSADINCIPACQSIELVLLSSNPPVEPVDTGYIDICPGDGIQLEAEGFYPQNGTLYQQSDLTSTFTWDFGDGTSGFGPSVYKRYENPGGYVIQLTIQDTFGCTNINFLSQRVRVSTFPDFRIAGDIPDQVCSGDTIDLTARISTVDSIYEVIVNPTTGSFQTSGTRSDSLPLPDGTGASYSTSILFSDFAPGQILTDINDLLGICVNMEHSWIFDLDILITCPGGTSVLMQSQDFILNETWLGIPNGNDAGLPPPQGQGADYCWTPTATNGNWTEYINSFDPMTLPPGDYSSFEPLENLLGCPLNGEWTITVIDQWAGDNGWIFQWGIDFEQDLYPSIETFTPEVVDYGWMDHPSIFYAQDDSITASPQNAGNASYTFEITDDFGCTSDTTVVVDVLPDTHPDCFNCGTEIINTLLDQTTCPGDPVNVDATTISALSPQEVTFEAFSNEEINYLIYPPSLPYVSSLNINSVIPTSISDVTNDIISVCIEIEHKYDQDLDIFLQAPDGTTLELTTDNEVDYQWQASPDLSCNNCPDPVITTNANNEYILEISDGFNCAVNDTVAVTMAQAFPAPSISCNSDSPEEIVFTWEDLTGANGYEVSLDGGLTWTPSNGALTHNVTGLAIGDQITLLVRAIAANTTCIGASAQSICVTDGCMIMIDTTGVFPPTCPNDMDGTIFVSASGGAGAVEYFIDGLGPMSGSLNGLAAGMHQIIGIDENNCQDTINVNLQSLMGAMQLSFDADSVLCNGGNSGQATVNVTGGNGNYSYLWNTIPAITGPTANGLAKGIYTVQVSDMGGCSITEMVEIFEPPLLDVLLTTDSVTCNGAGDGTATLVPSGGSGTYDFVWSNAQTSDVVTGLVPGNYAYTVSDSKGCMSSNSFDIFEPATLVAIADSTDVSCFGFSDGNLFVNHANTSGTVDYSWSGPNGFTSSTQNPSGIAAGNYCVTITDAKGCEISTCTHVNEPIEITLLGASVPPSCSDSDDGTATVNPSGGSGNYQYLWSVNNQITQTAIGLPSGDHTVTVTDMNGCSNSISINVPTVAGIQLDLDNTAPSCSNTTDGTAIAMASGGNGTLTYLWGSNANNQTTSTATNLSDGQYCVTVTDQNSCSMTACVMLMTPNPILIDGIVETPVSCFGTDSGEALVNVQGGTGSNYTFLWDDPNAQFANPAIGLEAGNYNVTVSDMNGCTTSSSVMVTEPDSLELSTSFTDVSCFGGNNGTATAFPTGGVEPYNYTWSNTQDTPTAIDLLAGNISVTITDANNCPVVEQLMISEPTAALTVTLDQTQITCFQTNEGEAMVTAIGGTPGTAGYQYTWSDAINNAAVATNLEATNYTVTVSDENACSAVETISIEEHAAVEVNIAFVQPTCFGQSNGKLAVNFITRGMNEDSLNRYTFEWLTNGATSPFIDGLKGDQIYEVRATDSLGCIGEAEIFLTEPDPFRIAAASVDATCFGEKNGSVNVVQVFGGASDEYTYQWSNNANGATTALVDSLFAGSYSVTVTDTLLCSVDTIVTIGQPGSLDVRFDLVKNKCAGGTDGKMFASGIGGMPNYNYEWSTGSTTDSVVGIWSGLHYITVTDGNNCIHLDSVRLGQAPRIVTDLTITDPTCFGDRDARIKVDLMGGTPPFLYSVDGENYVGSSVLIGLTAGEYELFVLDGNDCVNKETVVIEDPAEFMVLAGDDFSIEVGDSTQLNPDYVNNVGEVQLSWSAPYSGTLSCPVDTIPCVDPKVKIDNTIEYELYGIDENGCESTDEISIEVIKNRNIHVPTAFTPNGDAANDRLIVHGKEGTKILSFRVYDRWGTLVYENIGETLNGEEYFTNDQSTGWNGIYRGKEVDPGVFLWQVEVEYIDGLTESFQGGTTLLR